MSVCVRARFRSISETAPLDTSLMTPLLSISARTSMGRDGSHGNSILNANFGPATPGSRSSAGSGLSRQMQSMRERLRAADKAKHSEHSGRSRYALQC
jgi:hypothetical protein